MYMFLFAPKAVHREELLKILLVGSAFALSDVDASVTLCEKTCM